MIRNFCDSGGCKNLAALSLKALETTSELYTHHCFVFEIRRILLNSMPAAMNPDHAFCAQCFVELVESATERAKL